MTIFEELEKKAMEVMDNSNFGKMRVKAISLEDFKYCMSKIYTTKETKDYYEHLIPVPGISKEDISINLKDGKYLTIDTKITEFNSVPARTISLQSDANINEIEANCENGMLKIIVYRKRFNKNIQIN